MTLFAIHVSQLNIQSIYKARSLKCIRGCQADFLPWAAFIVCPCTNKIINVVGAWGFKHFKGSTWSAFYPVLISVASPTPCVSHERPAICAAAKRLFQLLARSQSSVFARWFFTIAKLERASADCVIIWPCVACERLYLRRREEREKGLPRSRQITKVNAIVCFINPLPLYARKRNCSS